MQLKLYLNSACELKNVNWRYGNLQPYAVAWIDSGGKCSTKIDVNNGENPVWNEMFTIPLPSTSHPETAILYIDIVHAKALPDMKPLIGSTKMPLRAALDGARSQWTASFILNLERPSGRPQGILEIQIEVIGFNFINQREQYGQQAPYMPLQPQPQPQPKPRPRPQPQQQTQYQARQLNQYPNVPAPVRPGYRANSPQNLRPPLAQQPGNAMLMPNMRPQYRPIVNQQPSIGDALCTLALGVSPRQVGRMLGSLQRGMQVAFGGAQPANTGMVNNTGLLGNSSNGAYGNDPSAVQGYDNSAGYDATGISDNGGYDGGAYGDGQFGTDGGFGCSGPDLGGIDNGGIDTVMFGNGGLDLGGFDVSGLDLGGHADGFDSSM
jgi:C2 domain